MVTDEDALDGPPQMAQDWPPRGIRDAREEETIRKQPNPAG
jgi:hypothetical protein